MAFAIHSGRQVSGCQSWPLALIRSIYGLSINPTRPAAAAIVSIITPCRFSPAPLPWRPIRHGHVVNITGLRLSLGLNPGARNASPELEAADSPGAVCARRVDFCGNHPVTSVVKKILGALLGHRGGHVRHRVPFRFRAL